METFEVLKITWDELEKLGYASVTDYCRVLVKFKKGKKLPDRIEIYRGEMLCMTVTDVAEAAKLEPDAVGFRKYRPDKNQKANTTPAKPRGEV